MKRTHNDSEYAVKYLLLGLAALPHVYISFKVT